MITASQTSLDPELIANTGVDADRQIFCAGLEECLGFRSALLDLSGTLDPRAIEAEVVEVTRSLVREHGDIGAILLAPICRRTPLRCLLRLACRSSTS